MSHGRAARLSAMAAAASSCLLTAATAVTLTAGPALADPPGGTSSSGGCSGQSCWVSQESQYIHLSGDYTNGSTGFASVPVPPPVCWMSPLLSGPAMYAAYEQSKGQQVGPSGQNSWAGYGPWIKQIIANKNAPGMWYVPTMLATSAGFACGGKLPLLAWVPPGTLPPAPPIPPATLAAYAYDHLRIPSVQLVVNPAGRNFVSLPTYVWVTNGGGRMPQSLSVTATGGGNSVTLTATASQLGLSAPSATAYTSGCTVSGSSHPIGQAPPNSGPGTRPDCGVVFTRPGFGQQITAYLTWTVRTNVAGIAFPLIRVTGTKSVDVAEIQNLNG